MTVTPFSFSFQAMGTACSFLIFAENEEVARRAAAFGSREVFRLEGKYSRYDPESYLSAINRVACEGSSTSVDDETAFILDQAFAWHEASDGLFDITSGVLGRLWNFNVRRAPSQAEIDAALACCGVERLCWQRPVLTFGCRGMAIDLGGIVKEYAADRAAAEILAQGAISVLAELGGDIRVMGERPDGAPWLIGIRRPGYHDEAIASVSLREGGLATSGDYERYFDFGGKRYSHILNPLTGWPIEGAKSVSAVAASCLAAGQASTIAVLKGGEGIDWLERRGLDYLVMDGEGATGGPLLRQSHRAAG